MVKPTKLPVYKENPEQYNTRSIKDFPFTFSILLV